MKATSMQIQKYQIKYQTANQSASAGSEGEMKVYSQSLSVLEKILQNWLLGKAVQLKEHDSNLEEQFQDEDNFTILNGNVESSLNVEMSTKVKDKAITSRWSNLNLEEKEEESTIKMVMPPKIIKRRRSKGTEVTVISLHFKKKPNLGTKKGIKRFSKLKPIELYSLILECFIKPSVAFDRFPLNSSTWFNNKCHKFSR